MRSTQLEGLAVKTDVTRIFHNMMYNNDELSSAIHSEAFLRVLYACLQIAKASLKVYHLEIRNKESLNIELQMKHYLQLNYKEKVQKVLSMRSGSSKLTTYGFHLQNQNVNFRSSHPRPNDRERGKPESSSTYVSRS